jgi:hypothetical protein
MKNDLIRNLFSFFHHKRKGSNPRKIIRSLNIEKLRNFLTINIPYDFYIFWCMWMVLIKCKNESSSWGIESICTLKFSGTDLGRNIDFFIIITIIININPPNSIYNWTKGSVEKYKREKKNKKIAYFLHFREKRARIIKSIYD